MPSSASAYVELASWWTAPSLGVPLAPPLVQKVDAAASHSNCIVVDSPPVPAEPLSSAVSGPVMSTELSVTNGAVAKALDGRRSRAMAHSAPTTTRNLTDFSSLIACSAIPWPYDDALSSRRAGTKLK